MLTKLLFTALILIGGIFLLRLRAGGRPRHYGRPPLVVSMPPPRRLNRLVYLFAGVMVLGTAAFSAHLWFAHHRVVKVRVVNTHTGTEVSYRAYQGGVDLAAGRFLTLEGQEVVPASVERVEIAPE